MKTYVSNLKSQQVPKFLSKSLSRFACPENSAKRLFYKSCFGFAVTKPMLDPASRHDAEICSRKNHVVFKLSLFYSIEGQLKGV